MHIVYIIYWLEQQIRAMSSSFYRYVGKGISGLMEQIAPGHQAAPNLALRNPAQTRPK